MSLSRLCTPLSPPIQFNIYPPRFCFRRVIQRIKSSGEVGFKISPRNGYLAMRMCPTRATVILHQPAYNVPITYCPCNPYTRGSRTRGHIVVVHRQQYVGRLFQYCVGFSGSDIPFSVLVFYRLWYKVIQSLRCNQYMYYVGEKSKTFSGSVLGTSADVYSYNVQPTNSTVVSAQP